MDAILDNTALSVAEASQLLHDIIAKEQHDVGGSKKNAVDQLAAWCMRDNESKKAFLEWFPDLDKQASERLRNAIFVQRTKKNVVDALASLELVHIVRAERSLRRPKVRPPHHPQISSSPPDRLDDDPPITAMLVPTGLPPFGSLLGKDGGGKYDTPPELEADIVLENLNELNIDEEGGLPVPGRASQSQSQSHVPPRSRPASTPNVSALNPFTLEALADLQFKAIAAKVVETGRQMGANLGLLTSDFPTSARIVARNYHAFASRLANEAGFDVEELDEIARGNYLFLTPE